MDNEIEIYEQGFVKGFRFIPYDKQLESNILGYHEGHQVERLIRRVTKKPSKASHGYYRGVLLPIAEQWEDFRGWLRSDIHGHFKNLFLKEVKEMQMGTATIIIVDIANTDDISQKKMNQFIDNVRQFLSERGIQTPDPVKQPTI